MKPNTNTLNRPRESRLPRVTNREKSLAPVLCLVCHEPTGGTKTICGASCRSIYAQTLSQSSNSRKY